MRYTQIIELIRKYQPLKLLEVGTWRGQRAEEMILEAMKHHASVTYLGFDLFEDATEETDAKEFNVKKHYEKDVVRNYLRQKFPVCDIQLVRGNTNETLKGFKGEYDFAFIDGGHSIETIQNDGDNTAHIPIRVFDDYYIEDEIGCPDITKVGCNQYIESLKSKYKIEILPDADPIKQGGKTQLVLVTKQC